MPDHTKQPKQTILSKEYYKYGTAGDNASPSIETVRKIEALRGIGVALTTELADCRR
jgi:hypothetical protein